MVNEIKNIDRQVEELVNNLNQLQDEIGTYESGREAFKTASASIEALAKTHKDLINLLAQSVEDLKKADTVEILKRLDDSSNKLSETASTQAKSMTEQSAATVKQISDTEARFIKSTESLETAFGQYVANVSKQITEAEAKFTKSANSLESALKQYVAETSKQIADAINQLKGAIPSLKKSLKELDYKDQIAELQKQNTQIAKQLSAISSRLDEGVSVKKRKWFAQK